MVLANCLKLELVENLPESWISNIPLSYHKDEVYIVEDNTRTETGRLVTELLNKRFVFAQLGLELQEITKRQIWYIVEQKQNGSVDLKGSKLQKYISLSEMIKNFCEKLTDFYDVPYWGLVLDELVVEAKARATILDLKGIETGLNVKTFPDFLAAPFFFLISEKEDTLKSMIKEMKKRGYPAGYYGIITQGFGSSNVVRLLMEMERIAKFYIFIAHDYDIDGLKILIDLKRYFPCESIGINPEFIEKTPLDFKPLSQDYDSPSGNAKKFQIKGAINMLNEMFSSTVKDKFDDSIHDELYLKLKSWIEGCSERKIELDALLAHRLEENQNLCKSRDLVDALEELLNDDSRVYDLNRYGEPYNWNPECYVPEIERPEIIETTIFDLRRIVIEPIEQYLKGNDLYDSEDWKALIQEEFDKCYNKAEKKYNKAVEKANKKYNEYVEENRDYKDSLKDVIELIDDQENKLYELMQKSDERLQRRVRLQILILRQRIQQTEEYQNTEKRLIELKDAIVSALSAPKNTPKIIDNCLTELRSLYISLERFEDKESLNKAIKLLEEVL